MKKAVVTPPYIAIHGDGEYAEKIMSLPGEKRVHRSLFYGMATAACVALIATCAFIAAVYRPLTPKADIPWDDLPVGDELFETVEVDDLSMLSTANYYVIKTEAELMENSELVVVGYPVNTFTDDRVAYFDREGNEVDKDDEWHTPDTVRPIRVIDTLKGGVQGETVNLRVSEVAIYDENGGLSIVEEGWGRFIQKQNVKYIFYLYKNGTDKDGDPLYSTVMVTGCLNIDGLHTDTYVRYDVSMMREIMERYEDLFVKYDRSDELAGTHTHRDYPVYSVNNYEKFDCEQMAYEQSDIVIVGSPANDIKDDEYISVNPQKTADEALGSIDARTLRKTNVLQVLKGDKTLESIKIATGRNRFFSINTNAWEMYTPPGATSHDPLCKKDSVYLYYLKAVPEYGDGVYVLRGAQCVFNIDGTDTGFSPWTDFTSIRIYEIYTRYRDVINSYRQ